MKVNLRLLAPILTCALLAQSAPTFAQQRPPVSPPPVATPADDDVVRITTNLVQVDAVVLDKDGRQVSDLGAEDFEIYEDGRAQKITNLSYVSNEAGAPAPAAPAKTEAADKNAPPAPPVKLRPGEVRRTIALVVDDLGLSFESAYYSRRALKKFVDEQMLPNDLVAIVRTGAGVGALQQFTSDKRMLNAAIERVKFNALGRGGVGAFAPLAGSDPASQTASARGEEERDAGAEGGRDASDELDNFREEIFNVGTLGAVNYVVRGMRELPGRKSIILMSDGFALFRRDDNSRNERTAQALRNLTDLANRASVVIYALDPRGLVSTGLTAADNTAGMTPDQISRAMTARSDTLFETQSGLRYLAEETGGFAVINSNDLSSGVRRVLEDQKGYYLIGYRPQGETFDRRYHKISVKVKRPGLKVRTRTGFYGVTDDNARPVRRTRDEQLLAALTSPFSSGGIDVRLTSLFGDDPKAGSYMRSLMHIDARDLKFTEEADGWRETKLDVLGVAFGDNGRVLEQSGVSHSLKFRGPAYEYILRNGLVFNFNVPVKKGGAYQLRVAVRDAITERVGSASQFVEAPDLKKDRLALSGLVINGLTAAEVAEETKASGQQTAVSTPPATAATPTATPAPPATASANAEPRSDAASSSQSVDINAGPAVRRLRPSMYLDFAYLVYNAKLDKRTGLPQLSAQTRLFRDGQPVYTGIPHPLALKQQPDMKRLSVAGRLRLGSNLVPGDYVLQVIITDQLRDGKQRVKSQWIDFEIMTGDK